MYHYQVKSYTVVDGDTIKALLDLGFNTFSEQRLRLARINAPELYADGGKAAADGLKEFLSKGPVFATTTKQDKYGRWIAEIEVNGESINTNMVNAGFAVYKEY